MRGPRQFDHNNRLYTDQKYRDITSQFKDTLYKTQLQNSKNAYMNDLRTCTVDNQEEFDSWLLSIEKVAKLTDSDPNEIFCKGQMQPSEIPLLNEFQRMLLGTSKRENVSRVLQGSTSQSCLSCIDAQQTKK